MTRDVGCERYQLNRYDFAYNRRCFLDTLMLYIAKNRFQHSVPKNVASGFEVAYATKKSVARISIAPQPKSPRQLCPNGAY
jgi:hypothetical protein